MVVISSKGGEWVSLYFLRSFTGLSELLGRLVGQRQEQAGKRPVYHEQDGTIIGVQRDVMVVIIN